MSMTSLTDRVISTVTRSIREGAYRRGDVLPPVEELAVQIACSEATVKRGLTELRRAGILRGVKRKGTVVVRRPSRARITLLLSPDAHTNSLVQDELTASLIAADCDVDVVPNAGRFADLRDWCRRLVHEASPPDCLITIDISEHGPEKEVEQILAMYPRHVEVTLGQRHPTARSAVVQTDLQSEARQIVAHLLELGHRQVAVFAGLTPDESPDSRASQVAHLCRDMLELCGARCHLVHGVVAQPELFRLVRERAVTAFYALNDYHAILTMMRLYYDGFRIPDDLYLVGRNNTPWAAEAHPALSSLSINPSGIAAAVTAALEDALDGLPTRVYPVAPILVRRPAHGATTPTPTP